MVTTLLFTLVLMLTNMPDFVECNEPDQQATPVETSEIKFSNDVEAVKVENGTRQVYVQMLWDVRLNEGTVVEELEAGETESSVGCAMRCMGNGK